MPYSLSSHMPLKAACSQYPFNPYSPVIIVLSGRESYCCLDGKHLIPDQNLHKRLKEALAQVGNAFEATEERCAFFTVNHTFTRIKEVEQNQKNYVYQVEEILDLISPEICGYVTGKTLANLKTKDVNKLIVSKKEDRTINFANPSRAYTIVIELSDQAVRAQEKTGLIFQKYSQSIHREARTLDVGQRSAL